MIRPRAGGFVFNGDELRAMEEEIAQVRGLGLEGVVIGAARRDARLDTDALARLAEAAGGIGVTLHRVVDLLPDPEEAVAIALSLGIDTILTSGGMATATAGAEKIAAMVAAADGRLTVMPGAGVRADTAPDLLARTGARAVHGSCSRAVPTADARAVAFGFAAENQRATDREAVAQLRMAIDR
jgi:copper homeostasis protein